MQVRHQGRMERWVSPTGRLGVGNPADLGEEVHSARGRFLVVHTPAKLNLFLKVLGRQPDGYHSLETVMVSLGLYDSLLFREDDTSQIRLHCHRSKSLSRSAAITDCELPPAAENLVVRAAELLRQRTGCERGVSIDLIKRIPLQAGLGGGSSDAAATLVALNRLWDLELPLSALHEMAAELGSDVNFFLESPLAAVCRGRGERVEPIRLSRRMHAVVVCPPSGLATADVFREWSSISDTKSMNQTISKFVNTLQRGDRISDDRETVCNDLEAPARRLSSDVDAALKTLRMESGGPVGMSGSGTSCYTLCQTSRQARRLAGRLRQVPGNRVFAVECCL